MKKKLLKIVTAFLSFSSYGLGFNINLGLCPGISSSFGGEQINANKQVWNNTADWPDYINWAGFITSDFVVTESLSVESGLQLRHVNLNYSTVEGCRYANGDVNVSFTVLQVPFMLKYSVPLRKTSEVLDSLTLAAGAYLSVITGKQSYVDDLTVTVGNFLSPAVNYGISANISYSKALGKGKFFAGIISQCSLINHKYEISNMNVCIGKNIFLAPVIGYTFIISKNKNISRVTEKNKRIKDLTVD